MDRSALELIPEELQEVAFGAQELARGVAMARNVNRAVREAADARLGFEDEPAAYLAFLRRNAERA